MLELCFQSHLVFDYVNVFHLFKNTPWNKFLKILLILELVSCKRGRKIAVFLPSVMGSNQLYVLSYILLTLKIEKKD